MTFFTIEFARAGEAPLFTETIDVPADAAVWCHVEAVALRFCGSPGGLIRVRDGAGRAVVRAGVATALASIAQCACGDCAVKTAAARGEKIIHGALRLSPCRSAGVCRCRNFIPPET